MTIPIKTLHKYNFYSYYDLGVMKEFFNQRVASVQILWRGKHYSQLSHWMDTL